MMGLKSTRPSMILYVINICSIDLLKQGGDF
jgi:hypothetical protein